MPMQTLGILIFRADCQLAQHLDPQDPKHRHGIARQSRTFHGDGEERSA
jgi:hypothetical protein